MQMWLHLWCIKEICIFKNVGTIFSIADDTDKTTTQTRVIQKQTSDLGAGGGYTDCDNIRFRYGLPEKIGGWTKTTESTLIGVVRDAHHWVALDGTRLMIL